MDDPEVVVVNVGFFFFLFFFFFLVVVLDVLIGSRCGCSRILMWISWILRSLMGSIGCNLDMKYERSSCRRGMFPIAAWDLGGSRMLVW